jgi:hypothetical protein
VSQKLPAFPHNGMEQTHFFSANGGEAAKLSSKPIENNNSTHVMVHKSVVRHQRDNIASPPELGAAP